MRYGWSPCTKYSMRIRSLSYLWRGRRSQITLGIFTFHWWAWNEIWFSSTTNARTTSKSYASRTTQIKVWFRNWLICTLKNLWTLKIRGKNRAVSIGSIIFQKNWRRLCIFLFILDKNLNSHCNNFKDLT